MSIEKEVNQLLSAFENVYFDSYRASLLISKNPITPLGYVKVTEENKVDVEDILSVSADIRFGHGAVHGNVTIEVWLGKGATGNYFKNTQNLIPVPFGITELLVEIFNDLVDPQMD